MELEILIAKANEQGISTGEFMKTLQGKCEDLIRDDRLDDLESVLRLTGTKPEFNVEIVQEAYQAYLNGIRFDRVEKLQGLTGIALIPRVIQKAYGDYLGRKLFEEAVRLRELTGIAPSEGVIQGAFARYFSELDMKAISILKSRFKAAPPEDVVQKTYVHLANSNKFSSLIELWDITNLEPACEIANIIYRKAEIFMGPKGFGYGNERHAPRDLLSNLKQRPDNYYLGALQRFIGDIRIKPPEGDVQEIFSKLIEVKRFDYLPQLQKMTGYKPSEEVIQKGFSYLLLKEGIGIFSEFQKIAGIKPSSETIQGVYQEYAKQGRIADIDTLKQLTGEELNRGAYDAMLKWFLSRGEAPKGERASGGGGSGCDG